jgi:hypothetical protein
MLPVLRALVARWHAFYYRAEVRVVRARASCARCSSRHDALLRCAGHRGDLLARLLDIPRAAQARAAGAVPLQSCCLLCAPQPAATGRREQMRGPASAGPRHHARPRTAPRTHSRMRFTPARHGHPPAAAARAHGRRLLQAGLGCASQLWIRSVSHRAC